MTIKDCRIETFRSGGKGGQNQNKRDTGVRVVHEASGAKGEAREERSQLLNKRTAFLKMADSPQFKQWHKLTVAKMMGQETVEDRVDKAMQPTNLIIETMGKNGWES